MSEQPKDGGITWCDTTWNPIRGCTRVSQGCVNCYAERQAARFGGTGQPYEGLARMTPSGPRWTGEVRLVEEHLYDPLRWKRPRRVFVNSMSDLFHEALAFEDVALIFGVMARAPAHSFQILTKRPARMLTFFRWLTQGDATHCEVRTLGLALARRLRERATMIGPLVRGEVPWPLRNVWLGVSCEDQVTADERIPLLLQTPATVRWVSAEPLLGPIDLRRWLTARFQRGYDEMQARPPVKPSFTPSHLRRPPDGLDWVVVGGESGPGARPMSPDWARSLRDQCKAAGVAFFMKQLDGKRKTLESFPDDLRIREFPEVAR